MLSCYTPVLGTPRWKSTALQILIDWTSLFDSGVTLEFRASESRPQHEIRRHQQSVNWLIHWFDRSIDWLNEWCWLYCDCCSLDTWQWRWASSPWLDASSRASASSSPSSCTSPSGSEQLACYSAMLHVTAISCSDTSVTSGYLCVVEWQLISVTAVVLNLAFSHCWLGGRKGMRPGKNLAPAISKDWR